MNITGLPIGPYEVGAEEEQGEAYGACSFALFTHTHLPLWCSFPAGHEGMFNRGSR